MRQILLIASLVVLLGTYTGASFAQESDGLEQHTMRFAGRERTYLVHTPSGLISDAAPPLVIALHGRPGNGRGMARLSQLNDVADRHGFIVVYPDGIGGEWTEHMDLVDPDAARRAHSPNDVAFLIALADRARTEFHSDPRRTYVAGFSNGGFMALRLACEQPRRFAAFAVVGAALHTVIADRCSRGEAPLLMIHGDADPSIPYQGVAVRDQRGRPTQVMLSVPETAEFMVRRNGCDTTGVMSPLPQTGNSDGTSVQRFEPSGCSSAYVFYTVSGGGHTWPGVRMLPEDVLGPTNMDFNAGEVIWDFFAAHPRP